MPDRHPGDGGIAAALPPEFDVIVIGAGLSGICMLERLRRMGLRARAYESGDDVGGVWYWNRYPGARFDSESYTYGYSIFPELLREWQWSELFAAQPEVERYLRFAVDRLGLRELIRCGAPVESARFDGRRHWWEVTIAGGERVTARYLIAATGSLCAPQLPDYAGMQDFAGTCVHTARWPARGIDLAGRRVGVIGTGATGVQVIQSIADQVGRLTVFQRTPTYCIPQRNRRLDETELEDVRDRWDAIIDRCRNSFAGFVHDFDPSPGLPLSPAQREARFESLWRQPGFAFWLGNYADLMMNEEVNAHACEFLRGKIRERVHDPETARRLLPVHPLGAKRVPLENGYYEAFNRDNVALVDLREEPILRVTREGIITAQGDYPLDILVCATGFDAGTGALTRIDLRGETGISLAEAWAAGPRTFLGLLAGGFPNLFLLNGPQNALALCNAGRCAEQNVDWIARCIEYLRTRGFTHVEPVPAAEEEWIRHVEEAADATVLGDMKDSWYFGANTPGKARRATIYAGGAREYREHCEAVAAAGYPGLAMSAG